MGNAAPPSGDGPNPPAGAGSDAASDPAAGDGDGDSFDFQSWKDGVDAKLAAHDQTATDIADIKRMLMGGRAGNGRRQHSHVQQPSPAGTPAPQQGGQDPNASAAAGAGGAPGGGSGGDPTTPQSTHFWFRPWRG